MTGIHNAQDLGSSNLVLFLSIEMNPEIRHLYLQMDSFVSFYLLYNIGFVEQEQGNKLPLFFQGNTNERERYLKIIHLNAETSQFITLTPVILDFFSGVDCPLIRV